ncbi:MAG: bifunctional oligoribonuclease/PAP phosphatase NrnA [Oscillospiraceae bacterium]|nr:bifunctional oligoribonuclease/PAP phosphatase NrnA [Oscillospiraceae bacterium]
MINNGISIENAAQMLLDADNILILCHKNPDGDTLGSAAALMYALKAKGKVCAVACHDIIPAKYDFLGIEVYENQFVPEFVVAVDVADQKLLGDSMAAYSADVDLCIDHHPSNTGYAKYVCCDGKLPAAAQLMYSVVVAMGAEIDVNIANSLYTGLMTDTGCFKFSSTTAETHIVGAELLKCGAQHNFISERFFMSRSKKTIELEKYALNTMEYFFDDRCALIVLTKDILDKVQAQPSDIDGISAIPRSIEGVDVGITIRQINDSTFKISVRTTERANASEIAQGLGGGGHTRAAGCEVICSLEGAKNAILREVETALCR